MTETQSVHSATRSSGAAFLVFALVGLALAFYVMMLVHEFGHVLGAWLVGVPVERFVFHPLAFSRTQTPRSANALWIVWAGPIGGVVIPLLVWLLWWMARLPGLAYARWFAAWCLVANGVYIGAGIVMAEADPGEMLRLGTPRWVMFVFGLVCCVAGAFLWFGQGKHFGVGPNAKPVCWVRALVVSLILAVFLLLALVFGDAGP